MERGADDIVAKPFSYSELQARVGDILRHTVPRQPSALVSVGKLRISAAPASPASRSC